MLRRIPLIFVPQPEGGFTVTSPILPELITEGDSLEEAYANVRDALAAVVELYHEQGRPLPAGVELPDSGQIIWSDALVEIAWPIATSPESSPRWAAASFLAGVAVPIASGRIRARIGLLWCQIGAGAI